MELTAGQTAVVTGAGSGMGRAFARRFAAAGLHVVAADVQPDALAATVAELAGAGCKVTGAVCDVSDLASMQEVADTAFATYGAVHVLCNNAGVEGFLDGPIWTATGKDWDWTVGVNFWSVVHGIRAFVPRMVGSGVPGHVVNTCSMTAVVRAGNMYGVTKHAVLALSEVLASDLRKADAAVGVTALCPGIIATNLFRGSRNRPGALAEDDTAPARQAGKELRERMHATLAGGTPPDEVAELLVAAISRGEPYLLTDHDWDAQITARHEAIMAGVPAGAGSE